MNTRSGVDEVLRGLDPAGPVTTGLSTRAGADLESIVSTSSDGDGGVLAGAGHRTSRRSWARRGRWLVAVAAVGAGVVTLTVRDPGESAYASWTAYPTGVTTDFDSAAAAACEEWWSEPVAVDTGRSVEEAELVPIMAETRGQYSLVLGESPNGYESVCLSRTVGPDGEGWEGSYGLSRQGSVSVAADGILVTGYNESSSDVGWRRVSNISAITGRLGDEVDSVTITTPQGLDVQASLLDGRLLAWWPWGSTSFPPSELPDLSFTVVLTDGEVVENLSLDDVSNLNVDDD